MPKKIIQVKPDVVRVAIRLHGPELEQVREIQDMLRLNNEIDAVRYLMMRGLESLSIALGNRRLQQNMANSMTPDAMVKAMLANGLEIDREALK